MRHPHGCLFSYGSGRTRTRDSPITRTSLISNSVFLVSISHFLKRTFVYFDMACGIFLFLKWLFAGENFHLRNSTLTVTILG